jgi:hypothetical protein
MVTRKTLYNFLQDFATNHSQINTFFYGDLFDVSQSTETIYPLMAVVPTPSSVVETEIKMGYTIVIGDKVSKDRANALDVENDTFQICLDLLAALDVQSNDWELESSATITPFREDWKDLIDGHTFDLGINIDFDYNSCQIP